MGFADVEATVEQISTNQIFEFSCTIDEILSDNNKHNNEKENNSSLYKITIDFDKNKYFYQTIQSFLKDFIQNIIHMYSDVKNLQKIQDKSECDTTQTIMHAFHQQCQKTPQNLAIKCYILNSQENNSQKSQTYSELEMLTINYSIILRIEFFKVTGLLLISTDIIPILMENNLASFWILRVLEAGCAYSIIDPNTPELRLK